MELCPVCKSEIDSSDNVCSICNSQIDKTDKDKWIEIGSVQDKISADYAEETLKSNDIPVVVISNSGFFGTAGLALNPFHTESKGLFNLSVPKEFVGEATDILTMILGDSWNSKE